jgi:hypothetical protein
MQIIDQLWIPRLRGGRPPATIQLLAGDLAAIPPEHAVDALVVSAFPNSYIPNYGTLFASLFERGLDMRHVAADKQEDERGRLGCWLSPQLPEPVIQKFHFTRVLCFEPQHREFVANSGINPANIEQAVGFVFRCLNNFVLPDSDGATRFDISSVAMPVLASGNQGVPVQRMFPRLLDSAIFWLEQGLPLRQLKIVAFRPQDVAAATAIFAKMRGRYERKAEPRERRAALPDWESQFAKTLNREVIQTCSENIRQELLAAATDDERTMLKRLFARVEREATEHAQAAAEARSGGAGDCDVFVSYAHEQEEEVRELVDELERRMSADEIFFDRTSIPAGGQWIRMLSDAIQKARVFVAVLSPDYTTSPVCWDEFQCAKLKEYTTRQSVIRTIRLYSDTLPLPPIMGIHSYIDCVEGDLRKLRGAAAAVLRK